MISSVAFHYNMHREDREVFTTTLYELDRLIDEKLVAQGRQASDRADEELVDQLLPDAYRSYRDVFSK